MLQVEIEVLMGLCFLWRLRGRIFQASLLASGGSLACIDITPCLSTEFFLCVVCVQISFFFFFFKDVIHMELGLILFTAS